jgi:hypothetical protein
VSGGKIAGMHPDSTSNLDELYSERVDRYLTIVITEPAAPREVIDQAWAALSPPEQAAFAAEFGIGVAAEEALRARAHADRVARFATTAKAATTLAPTPNVATMPVATMPIPVATAIAGAYGVTHFRAAPEGVGAPVNAIGLAGPWVHSDGCTAAAQHIVLSAGATAQLIEMQLDDSDEDIEPTRDPLCAAERKHLPNCECTGAHRAPHSH